MKFTCRDFWKMAYERECGVVVMLSDLVENGRVGCCPTDYITTVIPNMHDNPTKGYFHAIPMMQCSSALYKGA